MQCMFPFSTLFCIFAEFYHWRSVAGELSPLGEQGCIALSNVFLRCPAAIVLGIIY